MWHERTRKILASTLAIALALSMLGLGGCGPADEPDDEDEDVARTETVKIGVHTSLTGGLADYGFAAAEALKIAAEDFSGFEVDGVVYDIELVIRDDKGEPAEAPVVAQQLIDEGVVGVIGTLTSGAANAALPIYQGAGIPMISGSATAPDLTEQGYENFFRTCLRDDVQGEALGLWAAELGAERAVVMDDRGDYSVALGNEVEQTLEAEGVEVLRQSGQEGDVDFSAQVSSMMAFDPDVVIFTGYHREAGLLFKQLREAGSDAQFMGGDGIKSNEIAEGAGGAENVEGTYSTFGGFAQEGMPGYTEFAARFEQETGVEAGPYAENNYDALGALVEAITTAGSFDGADIIDALHEITYAGVQGTLSFDEKGDVSVPGGAGTDLIPRFQFSDGNWEFIG